MRTISVAQLDRHKRRVGALQKIPLFAGLAQPEIVELADRLKVQMYRQGDIICRQGDAGDACYFIRRGRVDVRLRGPEAAELTVAHLGPGEFFGEMSLLDGQPRSADVIAVAKTSAFNLGREQFVDFLRQHPRALENLLVILTDRLRQTDSFVEAEATVTELKHQLAERRRAEEVLTQQQDALKLSEARFRVLTENVADVICIVNKDGTLRYVSPSHERLLGYTPEERVGGPALQNIHPDDMARIQDMFEQAMRAPGVTGPFGFRVRHKDGSWRYWEAVSSNLMDEPTIKGLVVTLHDSTEQKQAEEELKLARRRVTDAQEQLRRNIAELLHSTVQTKLVVVNHQLAECRRLFLSDAAAAEAILQSAMEELEWLREHEVRQASHLLHPSIINIGLLPAIRSLIAHFEADLSISLSCGPELSQLDSIVESGLPEPLRLCVYRSVEEALSNVSRHARATTVQISLSIDADEALTLKVSDDGCGFDTLSARSGLGLSSIADRVSEFDGRLDIESQPGHGTTLLLRLPAAPLISLASDSEAKNRAIGRDVVRARRERLAGSLLAQAKEGSLAGSDRSV